MRINFSHSLIIHYCSDMFYVCSLFLHKNLQNLLLLLLSISGLLFFALCLCFANLVFVTFLLLISKFSNYPSLSLKITHTIQQQQQQQIVVDLNGQQTSPPLLTQALSGEPPDSQFRLPISFLMTMPSSTRRSVKQSTK